MPCDDEMTVLSAAAVWNLCCCVPMTQQLAVLCFCACDGIETLLRAVIDGFEYFQLR